jgi:putative ABC transport system substrate-binding protein
MKEQKKGRWGLMSYGMNANDDYTGAPQHTWTRFSRAPSLPDLPVEQPTKFEFVINLKAAKQIGVTIPPSVLARADRAMR